MLFLIFAHIEAEEGDTQLFCKGLSKLGFAYARGADKQKVCNRLILGAEAGSGAFYSLGNALDGGILPEDFF